MSDTVKRIFKIIFVVVIFVASLLCVILGQQHTGPKGLLVMIAGLAGLIFLLWLYNRNYR